MLPDVAVPVARGRVEEENDSKYIKALIGPYSFGHRENFMLLPVS